MLSVQNEQDIQCLHDLGMWSEVRVLGLCVHHVQEVLNVAEVLIWRDDGLSNSVAIASGGDGGSTT